MATMNISLSDNLETKIDQQVKTGGYSSRSDYMRDLVRRDLSVKEGTEELRAFLQEGYDSGVSEITTKELIAGLREKIKKA